MRKTGTRYLGVILLVLLLIILLSARSVSGARKKNKLSSTSTGKSSSSSSSTGKKEASRLDTLASIYSLSGQVIPLTDRNFSKFIGERPRQYNSLVSLTATAPQYKCSMCVKGKVNFDEASRLYHNQFNFTSVAQRQRLAFFSVEVDDARNLFSELRIETVPRIYFVPAADGDSPRVPFAQQEIDSRPFLEGLGPALELINDVTGIKVQILQDPGLVLVACGILSLLLALFVSSAAHDLVATLFFYQTPSLWSIVSLVCFSVGVSGSIFCIIRSAPPMGFNRQGKLSIFAAQGRDQYFVEGVIVAMWTVGCGVCFFLMTLATKLRFPLLRHVLVMLFMACFIVLATQIWAAYTEKTAWYSLKETVPGQVWFFLTSAVKKNSGLLKRCLRLSEIWLFEAKEESKFDEISKKFNLLIVDYLKRQYQQFLSPALKAN